MKTSKLNLLVFALFSISLIGISACQKDYLNPKESKKATAFKDGIPWIANVTIRANKDDATESIISLFIEVEDEMYHVESINFWGALINDEKYAGQKYNLLTADFEQDIDPGSSVAYYQQNSGHLSGAIRELTPCDSASTFLEVTEIKGKKVSGIFSACFKLSDGETIEFTEGEFSGKIEWN